MDGGNSNPRLPEEVINPREKFLEYISFSINGYSPASTGGAHKAPAPGSDGAKIGQSFVAENRADPYDDIIDHALNVNLVFFSTLETLRERGGFTDLAPSYAQWYHYLLTARHPGPDAAARVSGILEHYAARTGTTAELSAAREMPAKARKSFGQRLTRWKSQLRSFRLSAELDGENTVHSATRICDAVLGEDYGGIIDGTLPAQRAWQRARTRAKAFRRTL